MSGYVMSSLPHLWFGWGCFDQLLSWIHLNSPGTTALFTGKRSFIASHRWSELTSALEGNYTHFVLEAEPDPTSIDSYVNQIRDDRPDLVISIGGGSVIDAGKAVAGMVFEDGPISDYLEGVGTKTVSGRKIPFIAVPTTAGTGSEATKNAVISSVGESGFKKSLRHNAYVPDFVCLDPQLSVSCPPEITAAAGLDAITQLVESYVSYKAQPLTDAWAEVGLRLAGRFLETAVEEGDNREARAALSQAAYLSGVCLANAGLGVVHGFASSLGGRYRIPHGVACGTMLRVATETVVTRLEQKGDVPAKLALRKYSDAGRLLAGTDRGNEEANRDLLKGLLKKWEKQFFLPVLSTYGVEKSHISPLVTSVDMKNSPVSLSVEDLRAAVEERL